MGSTQPTTEREFQRQVTDLAGIFGWEWVHFRPAQTSKGWRTPVSGSLGSGWVDLVLIHPRNRRLIFAELKRDGAKPRPEQVRVLDVLGFLAYDAEAPGYPDIQVYVWRPSDIDAIAEVLR